MLRFLTLESRGRQVARPAGPTVTMETGQACQGGALEAGGARTGTWRHSLGLSVTEASEGLDDRRRRHLAGVLLLRHSPAQAADTELALCQGEKGRSWRGKLAPSQTKSLVN